MRRLLLALLSAALLVGGATSPATAEVQTICFPVLDQPVTYVGNFGDPRDGGARTHEGEDIMGRPMFRLVAATDGVILNGTDGIRWRGTGHSEHSLRMRGDDGYYYAYLHLNDDTPGTNDDLASYEQVFAPGVAPGVRVRAGQVVGYMGDSGNAGEGNDHLHFEIRTPAATVWQSTAIDPWDSLRAARHCSLVTSPTHPFTALGGMITSDPDAAAPGPGRLDTFARGGDNATYHRAWLPAEGRFSDWASLGGIARSGPASVSPAADQVDIFVRGADDALWTRTRAGATWGEWRWLGGVITADPDAASSGGGQITVSARGMDGALWLREFDGTTWSEWTPGGGGMRGGPTAVATAPGELDVFLRGLDDALWHRHRSAGGWGAWESLGGRIDADPDAAAEEGSIRVVVRGGDRRLYCLPFTEQLPWELVSTNAVGGGPGLTSWGPNRLDVVVAGVDGALYQSWWAGAGW